jgi:ribosomal-protein-alanine N-acetyltransferase
MERDADALIAIKNDKQVMKYHPTFFENATIDFIKDAISYFQRNAENDVKYPEHGFLPAVCLKDSGEVIGVITLNQKKQVPNEWHIGWYFMSQYTGKGYASEAGAAASDYFLEALSLDYISAGVRVVRL